MNDHTKSLQKKENETAPKDVVSFPLIQVSFADTNENIKTVYDFNVEMKRVLPSNEIILLVAHLYTVGRMDDDGALLEPLIDQGNTMGLLSLLQKLKKDDNETEVRILVLGLGEKSYSLQIFLLPTSLRAEAQP